MPLNERLKMERILTAFALAFGISLVWADSFNASLYTCVKGYCLPKNYNKLDIPNGSTKVYFQLPRIHPVVLREVNDVKRKLTLDMILNMVWHDPKLVVSPKEHRFSTIPDAIANLLWKPKIWVSNLHHAKIPRIQEDIGGK